MGNYEVSVVVFVLINDSVRSISGSSLQSKTLCRCSGKSICAPLSLSDGLYVALAVVRYEIKCYYFCF